MPKAKDPYYWARRAAKMPLLEEYKPNENGFVPHPRTLVAISSYGHGLYTARPETWWIRYPDGSWLYWTEKSREKGLYPKHPPAPSGIEQPPGRNPRWHYLTDDESYAAQRFRIDPNWEPSTVQPGVE